MKLTGWWRASVLLAGLTGAPVAVAHPGGLNAEGCHNDRKNGGYHCHRAPAQASPPARQSFAGEATASYRNCAAARAAGAAPIRRGEPGYGPHLDRDGDGVACER